MNYIEFTKILEAQSSCQGYDSQLRFAVSICEKMFPDYQRFSKTENWGDPDLLMDAINACKKAIGESEDVREIKSLISRIDPIIPDMDNFGDVQSSYALNASLAVYKTLEFIIDKENRHIIDIATCYTDTTDFKIQEDRLLTDFEIENHPVMLDAWNFIIQMTKKDPL